MEFWAQRTISPEVPDPFCRAKRRRIVEEPNEGELGKPLPEVVIRQLDAHLGASWARRGASGLSARVSSRRCTM